MDRIFLPYFSTDPEGTGLGLSIARSAVEACGGSISVESQPGVGTAVEARLPISEASSQVAARQGGPTGAEATS